MSHSRAQLAGLMTLLLLLGAALLWLRGTHRPLPQAPLHYLGIARFPEDAPLSRATLQTWRVAPLRTRGYELGYALASEAKERFEAHFSRLAEELEYHPLPGNRMTFRQTAGCTYDLRCIYEALAKEHRGGVRPLAERLLLHAREARLDLRQLTALVLGYVQALRYQRPRNEPFDLLPPALVAYEQWGDCDSKALLAYLLLRELGVDCVLLRSASLSHVAIGVRQVGDGFAVTHRGRRYLYTELTYPDWPVGVVPPQYEKPGAWAALPLGEEG